MRHAMLMALVLLGASACRRKDAAPRSLASHGPHGLNPEKLNRPRVEPPATPAHDEPVAR